MTAVTADDKVCGAAIISGLVGLIEVGVKRVGRRAEGIRHIRTDDARRVGEVRAQIPHQRVGARTQGRVGAGGQIGCVGGEKIGDSGARQQGLIGVIGDLDLVIDLATGLDWRRGASPIRRLEQRQTALRPDDDDLRAENGPVAGVMNRQTNDGRTRLSRRPEGGDRGGRISEHAAVAAGPQVGERTSQTCDCGTDDHGIAALDCAGDVRSDFRPPFHSGAQEQIAPESCDGGVLRHSIRLE